MTESTRNGGLQLFFFFFMRELNLKSALGKQRLINSASRLEFFHCILKLRFMSFYYTPGIYAEGYIVFVFPFVLSFICLFVRSYFRPVRGITSEFYVQATRVEYISPTTHQKAFIFGP